MTSLDKNKLPYYVPSSRAPTKFNPIRPGYKQEDIDMQPLIEAVYNFFRAEVVKTMLLGRGFFNVVYELEMKTGPPLVARIQWNFKTHTVSSSWVVEKMSREVAVLELLKSITFVKSLASSFVGIFNVRLPSIGSLQKLTADGLPVIGSILPHNLGAYGAMRYARTANDAFAQPHDQTLYNFSLPDLFGRIRTLAIAVIPRDDPAMLVPVLVHVDLNNRNIMVKDGTVSGILDWEGNTVWGLIGT
ncbi:hypothetical protein BU17DRAFT_70908 [Hysterangium stoloniferum]|nr:hypothetical protein BU17DRAFT_70908 [Hysterangium stoloniferum]